jgi:hypothetical protein
MMTSTALRLSSPPPLAGEGQGGGAKHTPALLPAPSPTLPRKRGRERAKYAARSSLLFKSIPMETA